MALWWLEHRQKLFAQAIALVKKLCLLCISKKALLKRCLIYRFHRREKSYACRICHNLDFLNVLVNKDEILQTRYKSLMFAVCVRKFWTAAWTGAWAKGTEKTALVLSIPFVHVFFRATVQNDAIPTCPVTHCVRKVLPRNRHILEGFWNTRRQHLDVCMIK